MHFAYSAFKALTQMYFNIVSSGMSPAHHTSACSMPSGWASCIHAHPLSHKALTAAPHPHASALVLISSIKCFEFYRLKKSQLDLLLSSINTQSKIIPSIRKKNTADNEKLKDKTSKILSTPKRWSSVHALLPSSKINGNFEFPVLTKENA